MNIDWPLLLFLLAVPATFVVVAWIGLWPYRIAVRRGVAFAPLYYAGALALLTPILGWVVAMVYATTATPTTSSAHS